MYARFRDVEASSVAGTLTCMHICDIEIKQTQNTCMHIYIHIRTRIRRYTHARYWSDQAID